MPSLKALRNRIASVKATQKITKAMQMVAAAKLRRAQEAAEAARPYAERMSKVLANIAVGDRRPAGRAAADRRDRQGGCASAPRRDGRARPCRRLQQRHRAAGARRCAAADGGGEDGQVLRRRPQGLRHPAPPIRRPDHRERQLPQREADLLRRGEAGRGPAARDVRRGRSSTSRRSTIRASAR